MAIHGADRQRLERVCRYLARGPLANTRLFEARGGRVGLRLKAPWRDGTWAVTFTPHELVEKLIALVPAPCANLVRYHGVFAPTHRWRAKVVRDRPSEPGAAAPREDPGAVVSRFMKDVPKVSFAALSTTPRHPRNYGWAELMRRVWDVDVLACQACGGRMKLIAAIVHPATLKKLLGALGLPTEGPRITPARGPPQGDLWLL